MGQAMHKHQRYVFVLWGEGFDEAVAAVFITQLREAGLRVKVVGISQVQINGAHGLALVPDFMLERALSLVHMAICIIIPYSSPGIRSLGRDPRVPMLCNGVLSDGSLLITGPVTPEDLARLEIDISRIDQHRTYPSGQRLIPFAADIATDINAYSEIDRPVEFKP